MTTERRLVLALLLAAGCAGSPYAHDVREWRESAQDTRGVVGSKDLGRAIQFPPVSTPAGWLVALTDQRLVLASPQGTGEVWKHKLTGPPLGSPVVIGDLVVQAVDVPGLEIQALSLADGGERWRIKRPVARLTAGDGALFTVDLQDSVTCLDPSSGRTRWSTRIPGSGWGTPVYWPVAARVLAPVRPDSVAAINALSGEVMWTRRVGSWPVLTFDDVTVYALAEDGILCALTAAGEIRGQRNLDGYPAGPAVVWGDRVVVSMTDGRVLQLDTGTLATVRETGLKPPLVAAPGVTGAYLAQPAPRGFIVLIDREGVERSRFRHPERLGVTPVASGDLLAVGGGGGTLVVYRSGS